MGSKVNDRFIERCGLSFLRAEDAIVYIKEQTEEGRKLLGIDAFLIIGKYIQPRMEDSLDFTASPYNTMEGIDPVSLALEHLSRWLQTDLLFEVVIEGK